MMRNPKHNKKCANCQWKDICTVENCSSEYGLEDLHTNTYDDIHNKYQEYQVDLDMRDESYNDLLTEMLGNA